MLLKNVIRKVSRSVRDSLPSDEVSSRSRLIAKRFMSMKDVHDAKSLLVYVSKENEVRTYELIKMLLADRKEVYAPRMVGRHIEPCRIGGLGQLLPGPHGIMEPSTAIYNGDVDICVVPGLVFDIDGGRIGYGGGYYDKFLSSGRAGKSFGLSYGFQIFPKLPLDRWDVSLDALITEDKVYWRGK